MELGRKIPCLYNNNFYQFFQKVMEVKYGNSKLHMMSPARLREPRSGKRRKRILKALPIKGYKQRKAGKPFSYSDISSCNQGDASGNDNEDIREKCADVIQDSLPIADSTEVSRFELDNISKPALIVTDPLEDQKEERSGGTLLLYGQMRQARRAQARGPWERGCARPRKIIFDTGSPCYPRDWMTGSPTYVKI